MVSVGDIIERVLNGFIVIAFFYLLGKFFSYIVDNFPFIIKYVGEVIFVLTCVVVFLFNCYILGYVICKK